MNPRPEHTRILGSSEGEDSADGALSYFASTGFYQIAVKVETVYDLFLPNEVRAVVKTFTIVASLVRNGALTLVQNAAAQA